MTRPTLMATTLTLLTASLPAACAAACAAAEPGTLRLVHQDEFSIVFMEELAPDRTAPQVPVEVTTWGFFDKADRLTNAWGWNTRISRTRIDCDLNHMAELHHQTLLDMEPVGETSPANVMKAPVGVEKEAILTYVCHPEEEPPEIVVEDMAAARIWADRAYLAMKGDAP